MSHAPIPNPSPGQPFRVDVGAMSTDNGPYCGTYYAVFRPVADGAAVAVRRAADTRFVTHGVGLGVGEVLCAYVGTSHNGVGYDVYRAPNGTLYAWPGDTL